MLKKSKGLDLESVAKKVEKLTGIKPHDLFSSDRKHSTVQARNLLCFWAYEEIGMTQPEIESNLSMTLAAVSHAIKRGRGVAAENKFRLF
ncbi:MAG: hypothetical protein K9L30_12175 [Desulfobacterales bacterium]|nr:hypothetical protein [Desulfobacterales bacterium]